jgi:hypothetical protein
MPVYCPTCGKKAELVLTFRKLATIKCGECRTVFGIEAICTFKDVVV